jgi:hypothetical protein
MIKEKEFIPVEIDVFADFRKTFSATEVAFENDENKLYCNKKDEERCSCGFLTWACKYPACKAGR